MFVSFLTRWVMSAVGLWVASGVLGVDHLSYGGKFLTLIGAGFFLALVNVFLKPLLIFLSLPAIVITLGLFMFVVNALAIIIAGKIYGPLDVHGFWTAVWAGIIIGLVNYLISRVLKEIE